MRSVSVALMVALAFVPAVSEAEADARYQAYVGPCQSDSACLQNDWFDVRVYYLDPSDGLWQPAGFIDAELGHESVLVHFFSPTNVELIVKVLDGRTVNERFWVFAAAATDLGFRIKVRDTRTGWTNEYFNLQGHKPPAITDTFAFVYDGGPQAQNADAGPADPPDDDGGH